MSAHRNVPIYLFGLTISLWSAHALGFQAPPQAVYLTGEKFSILDQVSSRVDAPQFEAGGESPLGAAMLQLAATSDSDAAKIALEKLAPGLRDCVPILSGIEHSDPAVRHARYNIECQGYPLLDASLTIHSRGGEVSFVSSTLPATASQSEWPRPDDWFKLDKDLLASLNLAVMAGDPKAYGVVFSGRLEPAWVVSGYTESHAKIRYVISATDGTMLAVEPIGFHMAMGEVFSNDGFADGVTPMPLPGLGDSGYLDGAYFQVFAPDATNARVFNEDLYFAYSPDKQPGQFNQVQSYFSATRALNWFTERFHYEPKEGSPVLIRVDYDLPNNARYVPGFERGPDEIQLGKADGVAVRNVSRDPDVLIHEYSHHIIFQYLKSSDGESGILHEGTADYFAYAISGDPHLGESLLPDGPFIRTADLPQDDLFDKPDNDDGDAHRLGQYWSAVLWDLRGELGEQADELVYKALGYLEPKSGLRDAFIALLAADQDLFPKTGSASGDDAFGSHGCMIIHKGLARGFTRALRSLDGGRCGLDLAAIAKARDDELDRQNGHKYKDKHVKIMGQECGVIQAADGQARPLTLLWCGLPILLALFSSFGRKVLANLVRRTNRFGI